MNEDLILVLYYQDADGEWTADRLNSATPDLTPGSASGSPQHAASLGASSQGAQEQQDDDANTSSQNSTPPHDPSKSNDPNPDDQPGGSPSTHWTDDGYTDSETNETVPTKQLIFLDTPTKELANLLGKQAFEPE